MEISVEGGRCPGCQEATEEELLAQLDDVLKEYADVPGALIPVLQIAQAMFGYLPEEALKKIALALDNNRDLRVAGGGTHAGRRGRRRRPTRRTTRGRWR